jgi:aryl-alcohol dehydrogenase-like predicted oxidoreductase
LTGKYGKGIPAGSRGAMENMGALAKAAADERKRSAVNQLEAIAADLGCNVAQLAIAWAAKNPHVSTVITGASKVAQLRDNLGAVGVIGRLTPDAMARIDAISTPIAQ